ncbi:MAG: replicative DNA helicase, partial [Hungatella sp.]
MDEALLKRVLPHSIEAEQSVIGSMLMDKEAIIAASEIVTVDDFYQHQYGVMFESMVELFNEGKPVDLVTLQNRLKEKDVPPEVSSLEFVRDIITTVPTSANVKSYANIVREKAVLRRLIKVNEEIANTCYLGKEKLEDILAHTEKTIFDLLQSRNSGEFVPIRQVALNVLETIEKASKTKETVTGIPTGFLDLDYKTSGFQPSDFILIAARPSMGKTAFVLNVVDHVAVKKGLPCMIFSLEMSKEQLVNRMLSMESNVDSQKLRTGTLTDADWDAVVEGVGVIGNSKLII